MTAVFAILFVQALLGAFDNLWHHELSARLPQRASARRELALHATREAIYGGLFIGLAWAEWHGAWALLPAVLLAAEVLVTCADFLEEDRSRKLPPLERVLHTVLAISYGLLLGVLAPVMLQWGSQPTAVVTTADPGIGTWFFTFAGLGVLAWSVRNALAVRQLRAQAAPPAPVLRPFGQRAVLVTGATGFIGQALVRQLLQEGQRVIVLTRDVQQARRSFGPGAWAIDTLDDLPCETRIAAIVHLAGAPVLGLPWTQGRRQVLLHSRTAILQDLLQLVRRLEQRPAVLVCASAVGFYGVPAGTEALDEQALPQPGRFQSELCAALEHEARRAETLAVRVVRMRFGIVLGAGGGAWPGLATAARFGAGARLGSGTQPVPWIHLQDAVGLLRLALARTELRGAVNGVAPELVTQSAFAQAMAASFGRRALLRVPAWALRLALGEMSELLLCGQRVLPQAALAAGYRFRHPGLHGALQDLAGPSSPADHAPPEGAAAGG